MAHAATHEVVVVKEAIVPRVLLQQHRALNAVDVLGHTTGAEGLLRNPAWPT